MATRALTLLGRLWSFSSFAIIRFNSGLWGAFFFFWFSNFCLSLLRRCSLPSNYAFVYLGGDSCVVCPVQRRKTAKQNRTRTPSIGRTEKEAKRMLKGKSTVKQSDRRASARARARCKWKSEPARPQPLLLIFLMGAPGLSGNYVNDHQTLPIRKGRRDKHTHTHTHTHTHNRSGIRGGVFRVDITFRNDIHRRYLFAARACVRRPI